MSIYYVRVIENRKPNGWVGVVCAETLGGLFWEIDRYVDPYTVEIKKMYAASMFAKVDDEYECVDTDLAGFIDTEFLGKWHKPIWTKEKWSIFHERLN